MTFQRRPGSPTKCKGTFWLFPGQETFLDHMNVRERLNDDVTNQRAKTTKLMRWCPNNISVVENVLIRLKHVAGIVPSDADIGEFKNLYEAKWGQKFKGLVSVAEIVKYTFYYEFSVICVKFYIFEIS